MKFIVIYVQVDNEKQNIGYVNHSRNEKNNPLRLIDVVARVKIFRLWVNQSWKTKGRICSFQK